MHAIAATRPRCLGAVAATLAVLLCLAAGAAGCSKSGFTIRPGTVGAIGAENQYANVISQIGGKYVSVWAILANPNTDPHTYESSPSVAEGIASAQLIVQNGLGYDDFMDRMESAAPNPARKVVVVQKLLGLPDSTSNPHLWYSPATMPAVASAIAADLSALQPAHAAYFQANLRRFDRSLQPWLAAIASFKATYGVVTVATTEPVADDLLQALGIDNRTPFRFQADIMNGVDPNPQDVSFERDLFTRHQVEVFCYNKQVVSPLTTSIRQAAQAAGIPVVGVSETMPSPGYNYQSWMMATVEAIERAVRAAGTSSEHQ